MAKVEEKDVMEALGHDQDVIDAPKGEENKDDKKSDEKKPEDEKGEDKKDEEKGEEKTEDKKSDEKKSDDEDKTDPAKKDEAKDKKNPEKKDEDKDEKKNEQPAIGDELVAKAFEEKYDISSFKDLEETLDGVDKLVEAHNTLKAEHEALKKGKGSGEPKFESDGQKKAFEFLTKSGYDPSRYSDGLMAHATLSTMDLKNADPKSILEQDYVLQHPELTRDEALYKFKKKYEKDYVVDKTKYGDDADKYEDDKKDAEIELKSAVAKATDRLRKKQEEFTANPAEDKGGAKKESADKPSPEVESGIKTTVADFTAYLDGFETIIFSDEKDPENQFTYQVPKKYLKQVREHGIKFLSQPGNYNEKGKIPEHDAEDYAHKLVMALSAEDLVEKLLRHTKQKAQIIKAEKIAEKKPEDKGGKVDANATGTDWMDDAEKVAESKQKERNQRRGIR